MRDIKFRAWDKKVKRFVEHGFSLRFDINGDMLIKNAFDKDFEDKPDFELMQFTGLHDKNGKEIYEGDVLIYETQRRREIREVIWDKDSVGFNLINGMTLTIIGNIYENPDLLNQSK